MHLTFLEFVEKLAEYFPHYKLVNGKYFENRIDPRKGFRLESTPRKKEGSFQVHTYYYRDGTRTKEEDILNDHGQFYNDISCGFSYYREPEKVARSIKNRFIEQFNKIYERVKKRWEEEDIKKIEQDRLLAHLYSSLGLEFDSGNSFIRTNESPHKNIQNLISHVSLHTLGTIHTVNIDLRRLSLNQSLKVIDFIHNLDE